MQPDLLLPIIDLQSPDRAAVASSIRQACLESGFFYVINHGISDELFKSVFDESVKFFKLPLLEKMKLERNEEYRGYTPPFAETLNSSPEVTGDLKESFYIGPLEEKLDCNQWPAKEILPFWRGTMEEYYRKVLGVGMRLVSLLALSLNLSDDFFERIGALRDPMAFLRLLHYEGYDDTSIGIYGASAHSDYGLITLLVTDGGPGLQICRDKDKKPQSWEDVHHVDGAFIVNVGDMLERWTNCTFKSTLHRVVTTRQERYSVAFFLDPNYDCMVECLPSCCSETCPPRFSPICSGDYLRERFQATYLSK